MSTSTRKGLAKVALLFAASLMAAIIMPSTARAITKNQVYDFTFSGNGATQGTNLAYKKDTKSESFIWRRAITLNSVNLHIDGGYSESPSQSTWTNCTRYGKAVASLAGYYLIHNYVYENGYTHARLTGWATSGGGYIGGQWSPDTNEPWHASLN